jgi:hypothetical protein
MWIDLGEPVLFLILLIWGGFVVVAFFWTFIDKKNRQSLRDFFKRLFETTPQRGNQRDQK